MSAVSKSLSRLPFAPVVALMFAVAGAVLVMATPVWLLERGVSVSGLAGMLPPAAPPLGEKARILLAVLGMIGLGSIAGLLALPFHRRFAAAGARGPVVAGASFRTLADDDDSDSRDAVSLRPISADRELGAPFMSDEALAEAPVVTAPVIIDQPAADAIAIEAESEAPVPSTLAVHGDDDADDTLTLDASFRADDLPFVRPAAIDDEADDIAPPLAEDAAPPLPVWDVRETETAQELNLSDEEMASLLRAGAADAEAETADGEAIGDLIGRLQSGLTQMAPTTPTDAPAAEAGKAPIDEMIGRLEKFASRS